MIVLGFDTATPATAVALRLADGTTLRARDDPRAQDRPGHTTRLLPLASALLAQAELSWQAVQRIAVGVGPGTFTGLRVGIAMARALAQSLDVEIVGVSSLRTLGEAVFADRDTPWSGAAVLAAIDARRGEAFLAAYARGAGSSARGDVSLAATPPRARARELAGPRACAPEAFGGFLAQARTDHEWLAVGDGAIRFRVQMEAIGVAVAAEDSALHRIDAGVLCELALDAAPRAIEAVLPDYRRRPDAEIALENAEP